MYRLPLLVLTYNTNCTIVPRVSFDDSGKRPLSGISSIITEDYDISDKLVEGECHLVILWRLLRYSFDHRCQICFINAWQRCRRFNKVKDRKVMAGSGSACKGHPIKKCPGVNTWISPFWSPGSAVNGLLLRQASICVSTVDSSSKISLVFPTMRWRCFLRLLTAASQSPPKVRCSLWNKVPYDTLSRTEVGNVLSGNIPL